MMEYVKCMLCFIGLFALQGCGSGGDNAALPPAVYMEVNGDLQHSSVRPEDTVVLDLEANQPHVNDTGGVGSDVYRLQIKKAQRREFCMQNEGNHAHHVELTDAGGNSILSLQHGCASVFLKSGEYAVWVYNGDAKAGIPHQVYIYPKEDTGALKGVLGATAVATAARAGKATVSQSGNTTAAGVLAQTQIVFDRCFECNLQGMKLGAMTYAPPSVDVTEGIPAGYFDHLGISQSGVAARYAGNVAIGQTLDLSGSSLYGADLSGSVFKDANFSGVDFEDANLSDAVFIHCKFDGATLKNADLQGTVWKNTSFGKSVLLPPQAVSRPSASMLFKDYTSHFSQAFTTALLNPRSIGFYAGEWKTLWVHSLPKGRSAKSAPVTIPSNFSLGRSTFVLLDDGIYEFAEPNGVENDTGYIPAMGTWHKVNGSDACRDSLNAVYMNAGGSKADHQIKMIVSCRDASGKVHFFKRRFYNNNPHSSYDEVWSTATSTQTFDAPVAFDIVGEYAYIDEGNLTIGLISSDESGGFFDGGGDGTVKRFTAGQISGIGAARFFSLPARAQAYQGLSVVITANGENNVYYSADPAKRDFVDYGHPDGVTIVSAPSLGGWPFPKICVLGNDGHLYSQSAGAAPAWKRLSEEKPDAYVPQGSGFDLAVDGNDWSEAYVGAAGLSRLDLRQERFDATYFDDANFSNADFSGLTLMGTVFEHSGFSCTDLTHVTFSNVTGTGNEFAVGGNCRNTFRYAKRVPVALLLDGNVSASGLRYYDFTGATFDGIGTLDFSGADMTGAMLGATDVPGIDASGADWSGADLSYAHWNGAIFDHAKMTGTNLYQFFDNNGSFRAALWDDVNTSHAQFQRTDLEELNVTGRSDLSATAFNGSNLQHASFASDTLLSGADFSNTALAAIQMGGVDARYADFSNATLDPLLNTVTFEQVDANLSRTLLAGATFDHTSLHCADFNGAVLMATSFKGADLAGAILSDITDEDQSSFTDANLSGANFTSTSFAGSDLSGALFNFSLSWITFSDLTGCAADAKKPLTDSSTVCPDGYYPAVKCTLP
jgi:uncharacterized protein YjbI with pentapeptide repeats